MSQELNPHKAILEAEPKYRKNLAQSLLYKTILSIIYETLDEKMKSAVENVLNRDVSSGQQFYKTDQDSWPMNKGMVELFSVVSHVWNEMFLLHELPQNGEVSQKNLICM